MLIDQRAVAAGDSYTVSGIAAAQNRYLTITNDSPFDISYFFDNNSTDARTLAPGGVVDNEEPAQAAPSLTPSLGWGGSITVTAAQPLGGTAPSNPPAQQVTLEGFSQPRRVARSSLARVVNVGNAVTVGTSNILQGTAQSRAVTTRDLPGIAPDKSPLLIPAIANPTGDTTSIGLAPLDASGNPVTTAALLLAPTLLDSLAPVQCESTLAVVGKVSKVANMATDGALGVVAVPTAPAPVTVTVTTAQNIIVFTPPGNGWYRAGISFVLGNGVSGNAITAMVSYQDATGVNRGANFAMVNGSTNVIAAGITSMANGGWACEPLMFYAKTGAQITISFRDPTNTPNDTVIAVLERLA